MSAARWLIAMAASWMLLGVYYQGKCQIIGADLYRFVLTPLASGGVREIFLLLALPTLAIGGIRLLGRHMRRRAVSCLGLAYACTGILLFAGLAGDMLPARLAYLCAAAGILLACTALGLRLLLLGGLTGPEKKGAAQPGVLPTPGESLLLACGLGAAVWWSVIFGLGLLGIASRSSMLLVLVAMLAWGARALVRLLPLALRNAREACLELPGIGWIALGTLAMLLLLLLPGSMYPPLDYDVLEYHLQLPREYLELGRIRFLPHNTFCGFPRATEMLSYACLLLGGFAPSDPGGIASQHGLWLAKSLHFCFLPLLCLGMVMATRRLCPPTAKAPIMTTAGLAAAVTCIGGVRTLGLGMVMYVELQFACYLALTVLTLAIAWGQVNERGRLAWSLLAGIMAGGTACCKYTGLVFVAAPVAALAACAPDLRPASRLRVGVIAGLAAWCVLAPWLASNLAQTGNPFYPLWNRVLGVEGWSPEQEERFRLAHAPAYQKLGSDTYAPATLGADALRVFIGGVWRLRGREVRGIELGCLCLVFVAGMLCLRRGPARRLAAALLAWAGAGFLAWFFLTHRLERFYHFGYVLLCLVSGIGFAGMLEHARHLPGGIHAVVMNLTCAACLFLALANASVYIGADYFQPLPPDSGVDATAGGAFNTAGTAQRRPVLSVLLGSTPPERMLRAYYGAWGLRQWLLQASARAPRPPRVLLVGSADPFWLPAGVDYAVVFSRHPLWESLRACDSAQALMRALGRRGVTHLYIDWPELARLHCTYAHAYDLTPRQQALLRDLLRACPRLPLARPWRVDAAGGWVEQWVGDNPVLLPGGQPGGTYLQAPRELFALPASFPPQEVAQ